MPGTVARTQVLELVELGAQLVEVLPVVEYDEEHLPDAVHLALKALDPLSVERLERGRPVIVYCWDGL